jgi:hypothetical protein
MRLYEVISEINDELIYNYIHDVMNLKQISTLHRYKGYEFSVAVDYNDGVEVIVMKVDDYHREYPNIEDYISKYIVSWYEMGNEAERINSGYVCDGFANERDYLNYKYG